MTLTSSTPALSSSSTRARSGALSCVFAVPLRAAGPLTWMLLGSDTVGVGVGVGVGVVVVVVVRAGSVSVPDVYPSALAVSVLAVGR